MLKNVLKIILQFSWPQFVRFTEAVAGSLAAGLHERPEKLQALSPEALRSEALGFEALGSEAFNLHKLSKCCLISRSQQLQK